MYVCTYSTVQTILALPGNSPQAPPVTYTPLLYILRARFGVLFAHLRVRESYSCHLWIVRVRCEKVDGVCLFSRDLD